MYWTAIVVEPTYTLLQEAADTQKAIEQRANQSVLQNQLLIENQDNNTQRLEDLIEQHNHILKRIGQVILIQEENMNETLADVLIEKEMRQWVDKLKQNLSSPRLHGDG